MTTSFDPYHRWLGISPKHQPADYYRLLGIERFESDPEVIRDAADRQMVHVRSYQLGKYSDLSQKLLNELTAVRVCLLNPEKKAAYDAELRERLVVNAPPAGPSVPIPTAAVCTGNSAEEQEGAIAVRSGRLRIPPAALFALGGTTAFLLLSALVWWVSARGGSPERTMQPPPVAKHDPSTPPAPPAPLPPPPSPVAPEAELSRASEETVPQQTVHEEDNGEVDQTRISETAVDPMSDEADRPVPSGDNDRGDALESEDEGIEDPAAQKGINRRPVPSASEQREVRNLLDETFNMASLRERDDVLKLADQLVVMAEKTENATERFVLLRRASELASDAGDARRMLELIDRIAEEFEVDGLLAKSVMLDGFAKRAADEQQIGTLVAASANLIDQAIAAERFDLAVQLAQSVHQACLRSAGGTFRVKALARRREVEQLRDRWEQVQTAVATLESNPDDEAANTVVGRWYGLVRGDWDRAIPHFAKGSEPELRALADREVNRPPEDATAQVELADAWWELAQDSDAHHSPVWLARAEYWYEKAAPHLTSVLLKQKVAERLKQIAEDKEDVPDPSQPDSGSPPLAVAPFNAKQARDHQEDWAKYLQLSVMAMNSIGMRVVLIPPGEFMMGSPDSDTDAHNREKPQHRVRITRPFAIGMYPVTQSEFHRVMGSNPSRFKGTLTGPVEQVTWHDAMDFCRRLSQLPKEKAVGALYRLPTEAEWEYACRAGTITRYSFGDDPRQLGEYAWFRSNSGERAQPVGRKKPNAWGLHDMHGNVREWCADWFADGYYASSPLDDPLGPERASQRVNRGGGWSRPVTCCRSADRSAASPGRAVDNLGFRIVLVLRYESVEPSPGAERADEKLGAQETVNEDPKDPRGSGEPTRPLSGFERLKRDNPELFPQDQ